MIFTRFRSLGGSSEWGVLEDGAVRGPSGDFLLHEISLLPPSDPTKIVCVGLNYRDHAHELSMELPDEPLIFLKPPSSLLPDGGTIRYPTSCTRLDYEGELGVVIGRDARSVASADAAAYIAGYTVANDITARDFQVPGSQWTRAKSYDTFAPLGPHLVKDIDPSNLAIETRVNGETRQSSSTREMVFGVGDLIEYVSEIMTLCRGDVIFTGTPAGVGQLMPGDRVEVTIEGIGTLANRVAEERHAEQRQVVGRGQR